jgi:hypothetical protein
MAEQIKREVERPESLNRSERPSRVPINGLRDKMVIRGQQPGWHYCWVNEDNVDKWLLGGYEFVTHEIQIGDRKIDQASIIGGKISMPVGNGVMGFAMRCPEEVYQEELRLIQERTDGTEQSMRENLNSKQDGRYGKVDIGQSKPLGR